MLLRWYCWRSSIKGERRGDEEKSLLSWSRLQESGLLSVCWQCHLNIPSLRHVSCCVVSSVVDRHQLREGECHFSGIGFGHLLEVWCEGVYFRAVVDVMLTIITQQSEGVQRLGCTNHQHYQCLLFVRVGRMTYWLSPTLSVVQGTTTERIHQQLLFISLAADQHCWPSWFLPHDG